MSVRKKKEPRKFSIRMQRKLVVLFFMVLLAFIGLGFRIYTINRDNGEEYKKQVLSQQSYDSKVIDYKRGTITDRKGTVLADSELVYDVIIDAKLMLEKNEFLEPSLTMLEKLGIDKETAREYVRNNPSSQYYIARKNLPYAEKTAYDEELRLGREKEADERIPLKERFYANVKGIWFDENYIRHYPNGSLASHVIGFTNGSNVGTFGLEEFYNSTLNGTPGREYGYLDEMSNLERTTIEASNGNNLVSTLDANVQSICEKYLKKFNDSHKDEAHDGNGSSHTGIIVMNPKTGEILGMSCYPEYDLNDPYNTAPLVGMPKLDEKDAPVFDFLTQEDVDNLSDEDKTRYLNTLWRNFCISNYFEPGSVAKLFTVASALECGAVTGNEVYQCNGFLEVGGWPIYCHNKYGDGPITIAQAVERSCNVALMDIAFAEGKENFTKFQRIFNLGLKTNIDLAGEVRTDDFLFPVEKMGAADLATNSFGQNFESTMIQMAAGFSSMINGGSYYEPHLVSKITSAGGATVKNIEPRILKKTVSESTSQKIREYCRQVVVGEYGTGKTARPAGYIIGGKTGTAETLPRKNGQYVVSFMGFTPVEDPQVLIYVVVDRANVATQDDAKFATGIVRNVLTEILPYLNIYMTEPVSEAEQAELDALKLENTAGKGEEQAEELQEEETAAPAEGDIQTVGEDTAAPASEIWKSFPKDPATGYLVDPDTGNLVDPDTGYVFGSSAGEGEADGPVVEPIP